MPNRRKHHVLSLCLAMVLAAAGCGKDTEAQQTEGEAESSRELGWLQTATVQELVIPAGTEIHVRLEETVSSDRSRSGDSFQATLVQPLIADGKVAVESGARVTGRVVHTRPSGRLKTPAELALVLTEIEAGDRSYKLSTKRYFRKGESHAKRNAALIGGSAAGGALIGALAGGKTGAALGAGAGAGGGTAAAYATGKKDIELRPETRIRFVLDEPLTVEVPE